MSGVSTEAADTEIAGATILASSAANSSSQSDPNAVTQQQHKQIGIRSNSSASYQQQQQQLQDQFASNISSSSSSALTNSPSSSLTSITTNSPTSSNPISSDPSSGCCGSLVVAAAAITTAAAATDKMNEIQDKYSATNYLGAQFEQQSLGEALPKECQQRQQQELDYGAASEDLVPTSALEPPSLIGCPQEQFCDRDDFFSNDGLVASANVAPKDQQQQQGMVGAEITASSAGRPESEATISMIEPSHACIVRNGEHTDTYITGFDEQPVFSRLHESAIGPSGPTEIARLERSNSCSQADAVCSIEHLSKEAAAAASAAKCMLGPTSISHENLASTAATSIVAFDNISLNPPTLDEDVDRGTSRQQIVVGAELAKTDNSIQSAGEESQPLGKTGNDCDALSKQEPSLEIQQRFVNNPANNSTSGASRFFSSKLNTGSLWSLLSVGSNHSTTSTTNANETMTSAIDNQALNLSADCSGAKHDSDSAKQSTNQDEVSKSSLGAGFFNRVQQFKRQHSGQATSSHRPPTTSSSSIDEASLYSKPDLVSNEAASLRLSLKRFRFQVKYIGSAILHKNFTLPMLEWIARDIKRQTIKGAQSISQRQFTIPVRDIILEIQSYQLMGTSCKDGHCIFVHPMHCVSKYAQLQHDPNCFSYLIRDTKESPYFCHVFQAKSTHKVHEIFSAIREATTSQTSIVTNPKAAQQLTTEKGLLSIGNSDINDKQSSSRIQKSASSDGQTRNIFGNMTSRDARLGGMGSPPTMFGTPQSSSNPVFTSHASIQRQDNQADNAQFENSYQFEVMFVKKVKLQCRRVPASFVDDALETLRSFDVMKGSDSKAQMKGIGKRIISASVDERQEYDEVCQSPTQSVNANKHTDKPVQPKADLSVADTADADQRRGSSASLNRNHSTIKEERESRSCQQSPAKVSTGQCETDSTSNSELIDGGLKKHYQSTGCLDNLGSTIKWAKAGEAPHYFNDFSPYNTITSNDLNERIAAIPVVSSSVSLDHETRQRLARQVRETIMATAANIKKDVYAKGDKVDTGSSFKVFDSLSCTAVSSVPSIDDNDLQVATNQPINEIHTSSSQIPEKTSSQSNTEATAVNRRSSAGPFFQPNAQTTNNFDLFRRTSARQVVKNRTMLLLIGKEELCTISIDKHQVLFSKSFSSIVHCLQGNNNRDHFGLICRDSGKINPNTESYVGLIFKCQSEKVVREIMGALKQVIYNSQHSYHGYNSIYNPFNTAQNTTKNQNSINLERSQTTASPASFAQTGPSSTNQNSSLYSDQSANTAKSLAAKRGFLHHLELDRSKFPITSHHQSLDTATPSTSSVLSKSGQSTSTVKAPAPKNLIKSMFCDNCPLYWYHRLCCDIESLPAEASKTIILRRIDSSLAEREQDELYSKFSEFNIESIDEHNEIFMSLLRHICERNQLRHNQTSAHQAAIARNNPGLVKQSTLPSIVSRQSSLQTPTSGGITSTIISNPSQLTNTLSRPSVMANSAGVAGGHQRSGSSGGSLGFVLGQSSNQSISNASTLAMDNLKRAKNNLSVSIENMLKRRSSIKDDMEEQQQTIGNIESGYSHLPARSGSFRSATRESRVASASNNDQLNSGSGLKRSSSTSDYSSANQLNQSMNSIATWKDSFSRTINDDLTNPFMGLFRRRSSTFGTKGADGDEDIPSRKNATSTDSLNRIETQHYVTPQHQPASPSSSESRFHLGSTHSNGGSSPSSMLSSAFWKKSIFDKIRQPQADDTPVDTGSLDARDSMALATSPKAECKPLARTKEELRSLWKKAIIEQITLIKMDKQNQRLQAASSTEHDIQRVKLNYKDVPYKRDALASWDRLLKQDPTKKVEFVEVAKLVRYGVPKQRRGEIWMFLMNQYQLRHGTSFQPVDSEYHGDANQTYRSLLSQLSTQQHEIFVDIVSEWCPPRTFGLIIGSPEGRTFPTHPYYSQYLSIGQLSLFNLLKAYSLLDQEVGYCQGLSFVAGILLLHVESEDEAFELMRHLLFNFGLRKQYLPSMNALHLQFYQITRLLRDYEYEVFNHFDRYDISPSLYAAPWFLTLFASQFPLGFVARLLDLVYLMGIEAIFRVSLNLLAYHRTAILDRKSLESTMDFMRNDLVKIDDKNLVTIFDKSMSIDLRNKLIEYEIEYTFYCAEDKTKLSSKYKTQNEPMKIRSELETTDELKQYKTNNAMDRQSESTSIVADATATVIIQHLLANNHLKTLQSNYSY